MQIMSPRRHADARSRRSRHISLSQPGPSESILAVFASSTLVRVLQFDPGFAGKSTLAQKLEAPMEITVNMGALDGVTRDWIQDEARRTGASVEEVVMPLIKRGIAAERQAAEAQRYHELDILASTWGVEEADAFRVAAADFARIDETVWQ